MNDKLKEKVWSFSSINTYDTCPHCFKLIYIDEIQKIDNAFAEFGKFCHLLLQKYFSGEIEFFELSQLYQDEYEVQVLHKFPNFSNGLGDRYYQDGLEYFNSFEGLPENYRIIGVEHEINLILSGKKFIGYIDLILQDKADGKYIIVDHKSKSRFKSKKEKEHYLYQLYLYALYIYNQYGEYPKELWFNLFRKNDIIKEPFREEKIKETLNWFDMTIDLICSDTCYCKKVNSFYCNQLCGVRNHCDIEE
jgi:hypothetical protein